MGNKQKLSGNMYVATCFVYTYVKYIHIRNYVNNDINYCAATYVVHRQLLHLKTWCLHIMHAINIVTMYSHT